MCPKRNPKLRTQHENPDVRSVGTTRPSRKVALFDEPCDLTDDDAQETAIRACCSANPGNIIVGVPRTASKSHFRILHDVVYMATRTRCTLHHDSDRFRGCTFRGTVFGRSKRSTGAKGVPGSDGISDKRGSGPGWNSAFPP